MTFGAADRVAVRVIARRRGADGMAGMRPCFSLLAGRCELVQRKQRVTVEHADLADMPIAGAGDQHDDAHDLLVRRIRLPVAGALEQVEVRHDLREGGVVDYLQPGIGPGTLGRSFSPVSPQDGMVGAEPGASNFGLSQNLGAGLALVGHERVKLLHIDEEVVHPQPGQRLASVGAGTGGSATGRSR